MPKALPKYRATIIERQLVLAHRVMHDLYEPKNLLRASTLKELAASFREISRRLDDLSTSPFLGFQAEMPRVKEPENQG